MFDIYEQVTKRITEQLEKGVIPWRKPWKVSGIQIKGANDLRKVAFNRITKTAYSPLNQMLLEHAGEYATFKQWHDVGGYVKKGEKAEIVVFWKIYEDKKTDNDGNETIVKIPILKYYQVFHISQIENVKPLEEKEVIDDNRIKFNSDEEAERIIETYKTRENIEIDFFGNEAYYSPSKDFIRLPEKFKFGKNGAEFYSTAFHEITHSTGAERRLGRLKENGFSFFGNENYSKEELVAEIGAAGMLSLLNIETENSFTNSTAYIQSWLKALKNDKKLIVSASSKAEKAIRYILNGKEENNIGVAV
ncbi:MAG: DUF1738 domain-containing protein [Clostridia bacterium]|nr:DUF1738 domain-containing protein [Clostridia bacterium]